MSHGSYDEFVRNFEAQRALERSGSVMAREPYQPGRLGVPGDVLAELLNRFNPINWMGGFGGAAAQIAPTGISPILQNFLSQARQVAPRLMRSVEQDPRRLFLYFTQNPPTGKGNIPVLGRYRDINPMAGQAEIWARQAPQELFPSGMHEVTHFQTSPMVAAKQPGHALETAEQLTRMMPGKQQAAMSAYLPEAPLIQTGGWTSPGDPRQAYGESLSYLTEALLNPQGGDPLLEAVAGALGQGLR